MYAWLNQSVGNKNAFLALVKQRLSDNFVQNWNDRLNGSSRARLYRHFDVFQYKPYLDVVTVKSLRYALTRFRVSSHKLEIEAGRWTRPRVTPLENRLCSSCHVLEDEYHFLVVCSKYESLRQRYIPSYYWRYPNFFKFVDLISSNNTYLIRRVAVFVYKALH